MRSVVNIACFRALQPLFHMCFEIIANETLTRISRRNEATMYKRAGKPRTVRYLFCTVICVFIIVIVYLFIPGVYFLNTFDQTFHFYV